MKNNLSFGSSGMLFQFKPNRSKDERKVGRRLQVVIKYKTHPFGSRVTVATYEKYSSRRAINLYITKSYSPVSNPGGEIPCVRPRPMRFS